MCVIMIYSGVAPGGWSSVGLNVETMDDDIITCSSTHLTSFAVLVDVSGGSQVVISTHIITDMLYMSSSLYSCRIYLKDRKLHYQL